jgi:TRAP-type C4-dicarboxylate transport system permease small subunit
MKTIRSAYDRVVMALAWLAGAIIAATFVLIVVDVTIRSLGYAPPAFTLATIEFGLLYIAMLTAPYLVRLKTHVYIDALTSHLPDGLKRVVERIVYVICIATALTFAYFATILLAEAIQTGNYEERGIDIPLWLLYLPLPICLVSVAIEFARYLFGSDSFYGDRTKAKDSV